ncbi:hypothetical protein LTS18_007391 [Coniosporium uncinatum]|uniref:Uncharacterized protein n=1 Tax=Coniosporium uncinatum TaxID=93489 RepID=A0ACC3DAE2_9PEZI|nr:hypothetical protein LTS18_007391 [Coniosporium uncinatum]
MVVNPNLTKMCSSVVATGAAGLAVNKESAPKRLLRSSWGFLTHEQYDKGIPAHKAQIKTGAVELEEDPHTGDQYLNNVINYVKTVGDEVQYEEAITVPMTHYVELKGEEVHIEEVFYIKDGKAHSHWHRDHERNHGADIGGTFSIVLDKPWCRRNLKLARGNDAIRRHIFTWDLTLDIKGRDMQWKAEWYDRQGRTNAFATDLLEFALSAEFIPGAA